MKYSHYELKGQYLYGELAQTVADILAAVLKGIPGVRLQQIQHRSKGCKSLLNKLVDREIDPDGDIESIKDLAGCRIVFYTNQDVITFLNSRAIHENFEVDWDRTKFHYPGRDEGERGFFISYNYVIKLKDDRSALVEYAHLAGLWCEVQVQTTLDHAWSEMSHDTVYKPTKSTFGKRIQTDIDDRMLRIMKKYLRPAGFDFQKIADDVDRLEKGRKLYEQEPLVQLAACTNNNERRELLSGYLDYVLPYYDDIVAEASVIRDALFAAAKQALVTPPQKLTYDFGEYEGATALEVVGQALSGIDQLRYIDEAAIAATFDGLIGLYAAPGSEVAHERILQSVQSLARNNLHVWQNAGPIAQRVVMDRIAALPPEQVEAARPVVLRGLTKILEPDVEGTTNSYQTITIHQGAVTPSDALASVRDDAIRTLQELVANAASEPAAISALHALFNSDRLPYQGGPITGLTEMVLKDAVGVVDFLNELVGTLSLEVRRRIESHYLRVHQRWRNPVNLGLSVVQNSLALSAAIERLRDTINTDQTYRRYKTLVGFDNAYDEDWSAEQRDISEETKRRNERIDQLVEEITEETWPERFSEVRQFITHSSDDGATFSAMHSFLAKLGERKPGFAIRLLGVMDDDLSDFLRSIMRELAHSSEAAAARDHVNGWLDKGLFLTAIADWCHVAKAVERETLERCSQVALADDDGKAVSVCLIAADARGKDEPALLRTVFLPCWHGVLSKSPERLFVHHLWWDPELAALFTEAEIDELLASLVSYRRIDHNSERFLSEVAKVWPAKVVDFFGERVRFDLRSDKPKHYEEIPFSFYELDKALKAEAALVVRAVRGWFDDNDTLFDYRGGPFVAKLFPDIRDVEPELRALVAAGNERDLEFVFAVMRGYESKSGTDELLKDLVEALPEGDKRLTTVGIIFDGTGVVSGEFGLADAYREKRAQMTTWQADARPKVRAFAGSHILQLDRAIAAEERRSLEEVELRKRQWGEE